MEISKEFKPAKRDPHLHSPAHVLADELSSKLGERKRFAFYLKTALLVDHNVLRKILGDVLEKSRSNPGAYFTYLVKKYKREKQTSEGYSLWLMPDEGQVETLTRAMESLAATYKSPAFKPHITLLGGINHEHKEKVFDSFTLPKLHVELGNLETEDTFFKSFYLPVSKSKELSAARRSARKAFEVSIQETYNPHMSILYGNFDPNKKLEMIRSFTVILPKQLNLTKLALINTNGTANEFQIIKVKDLADDPKNS